MNELNTDQHHLVTSMPCYLSGAMVKRIVRLAMILLLSAIVSARLLAQPSPSSIDLVFQPDPGIRVDSVGISAVRVDPSGTIYLYTTSGPQSGLAISSDGLNFIKVNPAQYPDLRYHRMPDGTFRKYHLELVDGSAVLKSRSSVDGALFTPDPGDRFVFPAHDSITSANVYATFFTNTIGGVFMIYLAGGRLDNGRSAHSPPGSNGWAFTPHKTNIFSDSTFGGRNYSYWDPSAIVLPDKRIRVFVMNQHGPPVPPAVPKGTIYSFTSSDHGGTFVPDPVICLRYDHFTEFEVISLNDPKVIYLSDGRFRMYVVGMIRSSQGSTRWVILSATTQAVTSVQNRKGDQTDQFALFQNFPNPFNAITVVRFVLPTSVYAVLNVFDLHGRELARLVEGERGSGIHSVAFDAAIFESGVYIYQLRAGSYFQSRKMVVIR